MSSRFCSGSVRTAPKEDRLQLSDDNNAAGVNRMHHISRVQLANPGASINGRGDVRVGKIHAGGDDGGVIRLDCRIILVRQRLLGGPDLFGINLGGVKDFFAFHIRQGIGEQRRILAALATFIA